MKTVVAVRVLRPSVIEVEFDGGTVRQVDLEPILRGRVFAPLRDPISFAQATVDPESETVVWPNGADVSPEFLSFGDENPYAAFLEPAPSPSRDVDVASSVPTPRSRRSVDPDAGFNLLQADGEPGDGRPVLARELDLVRVVAVDVEDDAGGAGRHAAVARAVGEESHQGEAVEWHGRRFLR